MVEDFEHAKALKSDHEMRIEQVRWSEAARTVSRAVDGTVSGLEAGKGDSVSELSVSLRTASAQSTEEYRPVRPNTVTYQTKATINFSVFAF